MKYIYCESTYFSTRKEINMITFKEAKKNFGFGCMRLPLLDGGEVDTDQFSKMVDAFIGAGFNYFDTAHGYLGGKSETALKASLTSRYPRDAYVLTNKLSSNHFEKEEDIRPLFQSQLEACGVDYFDFYLMHAQNSKNFEQYKSARAYETALELKKEGKIRHLGISFHDSADVLDMILTTYPEIEIVQIQFNYIDFEDEGVQSRKCYEVCRKHNKPIIVMEPVKGGSLVSLPEEAGAILDSLGDGSHASYAIRYAASFEGIEMVLSGMGNMDMVNDNISYMQDFKPLCEKEYEAIDKVVKIIRSRPLIACTDCKYCTERCPQGIPIPQLFACMNDHTKLNLWRANYLYNKYTAEGGRANECIECGACEAACPQKLPIRELLKNVSAQFDK